MTEFSLTRRRFAVGAAAATAAMALPGGVVSATPTEEQATTAPDSKVTAMPATLDQQAQEAFAKLSASAKAEVEMKFQNVLRKYGDKLSAEQKSDVRKALAEGQEGLEAMRAFVLANGDQPAAVFHIYRGEGKK
jgi:cob(I)alamin adenosyltransferase